MPINLLPRKPSSYLDRFLSWISTYGRFIIVLTELVVLVAFASRFKLDRDLIDLQDKIKQEESMVKSLTSIEKKSRNLQARLSQIASLNGVSQSSMVVLSEISALVPANVFLDELTLEEQSVKIQARAFSGEGISNFVKRLGNNSYLSNVNVSQVDRDESLGGQVKFTVMGAVIYANLNK